MKSATSYCVVVRYILPLTLIGLLLAACAGPRPLPVMEGPAVGGVPVYPGARTLDDPPLLLRGIYQSHGAALRDVQSGTFHTPDSADVVLNYYQDEMRRLGWTFIDQIEFGGNNRIRRFLRDGRRGILAAIPENGETLLLIMDGAQ